jgi:hypothetical protein
MTTFTLSITIPEGLLEVEEAELVSTTLQALAQDVHRWRAVPASRRLRDRAGAVVGWAGTEDEPE